jgi:hypothetical protein
VGCLLGVEEGVGCGDVRKGDGRLRGRYRVPRWHYRVPAKGLAEFHCLLLQTTFYSRGSGRLRLGTYRHRRCILGSRHERRASASTATPLREPPWRVRVAPYHHPPHHWTPNVGERSRTATNNFKGPIINKAAVLRSSANHGERHCRGTRIRVFPLHTNGFSWVRFALPSSLPSFGGGIKRTNESRQLSAPE